LFSRYPSFEHIPNSVLPFTLVIENSLTDSAEAIGWLAFPI
jgi:hypothetical protein